MAAARRAVSMRRMTSSKTTRLGDPELIVRLERADHVLIAGAGGGYDIFAGLPIALALIARGKRVTLANLTFTYLGGTNARFVAPHVAEVHADTEGEDRYFPERALARWFRTRGDVRPIYALEKVGVAPMRAAYEALCRRLRIDAVLLVDGGTDILMRGDEAGLGTPQEDMVSLAAARSLDMPTKLVACIGFGIDAHHGVCHAHFLENVAALDREGAYLGVFDVGRRSEEGRAFLDAVAFAHALMPSRTSIVNGSIASAIRGDFGDVHSSERTKSGELFINPLMSMYFGFELEGVAKRSLYLHMLERTQTIFEVSAVIEAFRETTSYRPRRLIPH